MAKPQTPRPNEAANVGAENIPPGATREALNRERMPDAPGPEETEGDEARGDSNVGAEPGRPTE